MFSAQHQERHQVSQIAKGACRRNELITYFPLGTLTERVAGYAFELVKQLNTDHFGEIIVHGSFADLTVCITEFCKVNKYQKISLHAVDMLRSVVPAMLNAAECPITPNSDPGPAADTPLKNDPMVEYWYPVLFAHYEIIMSGDDLEVRRV